MCEEGPKGATPEGRFVELKFLKSADARRFDWKKKCCMTDGQRVVPIFMATTFIYIVPSI
jgi:hypothetical protein